MNAAPHENLAAARFRCHVQESPHSSMRLRLEIASNKVAPFAFRPSTAHDEEMGESCERCGKPGKPCSIQDPTISGKWNPNSLRSMSRCDSTNGCACLQVVPQILCSSKSSNSHFQDQSLESQNRPA